MSFLYGPGPYGQSLYSSGGTFDYAGAIAITLNLDGAFSQPVEFNGALSITLGLRGDATELRPLSGRLDIQVPLEGNLSGIYPLTGALLQLTLDIAAEEPLVGPLWQPQTLCPDPGWAAQEACNG